MPSIYDVVGQKKNSIYDAITKDLEGNRPSFMTTPEDVRDTEARKTKEAKEYPDLHIIDSGLPPSKEVKDVQTIGTRPSGGYDEWRSLEPPDWKSSSTYEKFVFGVSNSRAAYLASRFGKQLSNAFSNVAAGILSHELSPIGPSNKETEKYRRQATVEFQRDWEGLSPAQAEKLIQARAEALASAEIVPRFKMETAQDISEQAVDISASLTAFVAQLALTKQIMPAGTPDPVIWEIQNQATGGIPGEGMAMRTALGEIGRVPIGSLKGKLTKIGLESGLFAGYTAATGGDAEDIIVAGLIPVAFNAWGFAQQRKHLADYQNQLKRSAQRAHQRRTQSGMLKTTSEAYLKADYRLIEKAVQRAKQQIYHDDAFASAKGKWKAEREKALKLLRSSDPVKRRMGNDILDFLGKIPGKEITPIGERIKKARAGRVYRIQEAERISKISERYDKLIRSATQRGDAEAAKAHQAAKDFEISHIVPPKYPAERVVFPDVKEDEFVMPEEEEAISKGEMAEPSIPTEEALETPDTIMTDKGIDARLHELEDKPTDKLMEDIERAGEDTYANLPPETVQELADNGVQGAQDVVAKETGVKPPSITNEQQKEILLASLEYNLKPDQIEKLIKDVTGRDSLDDVSKEGADAVIKLLRDSSYSKVWGGLDLKVEPEMIAHPAISEIDRDKIRKNAGSNLVYNRAVSYAMKLNMLPTNPDLPDYENQLKGSINDIITRAKDLRSGREKEMKGKPFLSVVQNARYTMDKYEQQTGVLLRRMYSNAVATVRKWIRENEILTWQVVKDAGVSRFGIVMDKEKSTHIAQYLNEENEILRKYMRGKMDEKMVKLSNAMDHLLQTRGAFLVRWARFVKWDYYARMSEEYLNGIYARGKKPSDTQINRALKVMKKVMPPNASMVKLGEGRRIRDELGDQAFFDWLTTETWGTRKRYYMTSHELAQETSEAANLDELSDTVKKYLEGSEKVPEDIFNKIVEAGDLALGAPSETEARRGKAQVIESNNIALDVLRHLDRLAAFASTYDQRAKLWASFISGNPTKEDIGLMRQADRTMRGVYEPTMRMIKHTRNLDRTFWRSKLVLQPHGSIWFAYRQALQNPALASPHFNVDELHKSMGKFMSLKSAKAFFDANPQARELFGDYLQANIAEGRAQYRYFIMKEPGIGEMQRSGKLGQAGAILDSLAVAPQITDWMNRRGIWPVAFDMAQRNVGIFARGEIGVDELWHLLSMNTLIRGQAMEMRGLLAQENYFEFVKRYAEYKTENIHGRYHPSLRGLAEMTTTGRTLYGLIVFPRLYANIALKGGIEPIADAIKTPTRRNMTRAYDGFKLLLKLFATTTAVSWLSYNVFGRKIYDLLGTMSYNLGTPGFGIIYETIEDIGRIQANAATSDEPMDTTAGKLMKLASNRLELFIPLCEVLIHAYEVDKDVEHVKLWQGLRHLSLNEYERVYGEKWNPRKRSTFEKWSYMLLGKEGKEPEDWKLLYDELQKGRSSPLFKKEMEEWKP